MSDIHYAKYIRYTLLPSGNVYKIESYCPLVNLQKYMKDTIQNNIAFIVESDPKILFLNEQLFEKALQCTDSNNSTKEIIMTMKHIERGKGSIITY